jgi:hypothetical protein
LARCSASRSAIRESSANARSTRLLGSELRDLLHTLATCPKARSASIHDRSKAVFQGLAV